MSHHHSNNPTNQSEDPGTAASTQTASHGGGACITAPTHEDIAKRAYGIYLKTGRKQGQCKQNWQQAEQSFSGQPARLPEPRNPDAFTPQPAGGR